MSDTNLGKWDAWYKTLSSNNASSFKFGETITYKVAADFLSDCISVEDWGIGAGGFLNHRPNAIGVDGSKTPFAQKVVDLCEYTTKCEGVHLRHVLEHNYQWKNILINAMKSAEKKIAITFFIKFSNTNTILIKDNHNFGVNVPDLSISKQEFLDLVKDSEFKIDTFIEFTTNTSYKYECCILLIKKQLPNKKYKIISANFGNHASILVENLDEIKSNNIDIVIYNDENFDSRSNSLHPRLKGKIPKMLEWMHDSCAYDYYIWIDSKFILKEGSIKYLINGIKEKDICLFRHPNRSSIFDEAKFVMEHIRRNEYLKSRYSGESIVKQMIQYLSDPNFIDNNLFACGCFIYSKKIVANTSYNLMTDWFLHNCLYSVEDQISFPYLLYKHNIQFNCYDLNIMKNPYLIHRH